MHPLGAQELLQTCSGEIWTCGFFLDDQHVRAIMLPGDTAPEEPILLDQNLFGLLYLKNNNNNNNKNLLELNEEEKQFLPLQHEDTPVIQPMSSHDETSKQMHYVF